MTLRPATVGDTTVITKIVKRWDATTEALVVVDISSETTMEVHFNGPNGEASILDGTWTTDGTDGSFTVTTVAGTWTTSGLWTEQTFVVLATGGWGDVTEEVREIKERRLAHDDGVFESLMTLRLGESLDGVFLTSKVFTLHSTTDISSGTATLTFTEKYCDLGTVGTVTGTVALLGSNMYSATFAIPITLADSLEAGRRTTYRAIVNHGTSEKLVGFGDVDVQ